MVDLPQVDLRNSGEQRLNIVNGWRIFDKVYLLWLDYYQSYLNKLLRIVGRIISFNLTVSFYVNNIGLLNSIL